MVDDPIAQLIAQWRDVVSPEPSNATAQELCVSPLNARRNNYRHGYAEGVRQCAAELSARWEGMKKNKAPATDTIVQLMAMTEYFLTRDRWPLYEKACREAARVLSEPEAAESRLEGELISLQREIVLAREACPVVRQDRFADAPLLTLVNEQVSQLFRVQSRADKAEAEREEARKERNEAKALALGMELARDRAMDERDKLTAQLFTADSTVARLTAQLQEAQQKDAGRMAQFEASLKAVRDILYGEAQEYEQRAEAAESQLTAMTANLKVWKQSAVNMQDQRDAIKDVLEGQLTALRGAMSRIDQTNGVPADVQTIARAALSASSPLPQQTTTTDDAQARIGQLAEGPTPQHAPTDTDN